MEIPHDNTIFILPLNFICCGVQITNKVLHITILLPLGIAISPIAVSCVNQIVHQHFVKSGISVKFLTGLTENGVCARMGSNDGERTYPFSKISSAVLKSSRKDDVIIPKGTSYSRVKECTHNLWKDKTKTIFQIPLGFRNMFWCFHILSPTFETGPALYKDLAPRVYSLDLNTEVRD